MSDKDERVNLRSFLKNVRHYHPGNRNDLQRYRVIANSDGVSCKKPTGDVFEVKWEKLQTILIQAHEPVPGLPSMMWILGGDGSCCVIPQGARGEDNFIAWIKQLPNFNQEKLEEALHCEKEDSFLCWERPTVTEGN
ncbi:hypothetical protein N9B94_01275 [Verrucomicrobia bacterium]|nr:hypothetical protein [Verrucomicrobiota bacterium]